MGQDWGKRPRQVDWVLVSFTWAVVVLLLIAQGHTPGCG